MLRLPHLYLLLVVLISTAFSGCISPDDSSCPSGVGELQILNHGSASVTVSVLEDDEAVFELTISSLFVEQATLPVGTLRIKAISQATGELVEDSDVTIQCDALTSVIIEDIGPMPTPTPVPTPAPTPSSTPVPTPTPVPNVLSLQSITSVTIEAEQTLNITASATDFRPLSFSLTQAPQGMTISDEGALTWTPSLQNIAVHSITVQGTDLDSGLVATTSFQVTVNPILTIDQTTFLEGEVSDPLFSLLIKGDSAIVSVTSNELWNGFTPLVADSNGATILMSGVTRPVINIPSNTGDILLDISGGVKTARSFLLDITVRFQNGRVYSKNFPIVIQSAGLPYLRYDIFTVGAAGENPFSLLNSATEAKNTFREWRTPILTRYRSEEIICNGSSLTVYDAAVPGQSDCLAARVSDDSETAFFFSSTWAGASRIGGIANGARHGFVVERNPWTHTLVHELGHQFGLFHTFETAFNPTVAHQDATGYYYWSLVKSTHPQDTRLFQGDFSNNIFSWNSGGGTALITAFDFSGILDDTPTDPLGAFFTTLDNPNPIGFPNDPYQNGDSIMLTRGQGSGSVCQQSGYDPETDIFPVFCSTESGFIIIGDVINNVMSYWMRNVGRSHFSPQQKQRMSRVLSTYPELSAGGI